MEEFITIYFVEGTEKTFPGCLVNEDDEWIYFQGIEGNPKYRFSKETIAGFSMEDKKV